MNWLSLTGKAAIVTGGAAGIGAAVCSALAAQGVNVAVADMNEATGLATVEELNNAGGGKAIFAKCDVSKKAEVEALLQATEEAFGGVDILVNNAGILIPRLLVDPAGKEEIDEAIFDLMINVNLKGTVFCSQAAARVMLKNSGGVIINMASESGLEGSEGQSVYAATKGALYSFTRSWAKELGTRGIRVVGLAPGILEATGLRSEAYEKSLAYARGISVEDLRAGYEKMSIPLGRVGRLSEVADAVCFLASERAGYMHGTVLNLSGGKSRA